MKNRTILTSAPSNIALIKYMGKREPSVNFPANGSLSMTLNSLCTYVEILSSDDLTEVQWEAHKPEVPGNSDVLLPILSENGRGKLLRHCQRVVKSAQEIFLEFGVEHQVPRGMRIRTGNTFPEASGIASSASSFAAITLAVAAACAADPKRMKDVFEGNVNFRRELARLSRLGSGSSCRSFEGPWVLWEEESASSIRTEMPEMVDLVILVSSHPKKVSSSEAHSRVQTSPLWEGRMERVDERLKMILAALGEGNLGEVSRIAWSETWEMHSLFHTSAQPFTYWEPGTIEILQWLHPFMGRPESPIVTLDAGPNVHLLIPKDQGEEWKSHLHQAFPQTKILVDSAGTGAKIIAI